MNEIKETDFTPRLTELAQLTANVFQTHRALLPSSSLFAFSFPFLSAFLWAYYGYLPMFTYVYSMY